MFGRALARPLRVLARTADAFGNGDLATRIELERGDEIGDVSTAFNAMGDRLQALLRSEKDLLASVSHELRTPLARLRVGLKLAASDPTTAAIEDLEADVMELNALVEHLMFSAQLEAGQRDSSLLPAMNKEVVDVVDLVNEAVDLFARQTPERTVEVRVNGRTTVFADPSLLRRALLNLLDNGHKFTPNAAAAIVVRVEVNDAQVKIVADDEGIGFDDTEAALRPFVRGDRAHRLGIKGAGHGLSLVQHIMAAHDGAIQIGRRPTGASVALVLEVSERPPATTMCRFK